MSSDDAPYSLTYIPAFEVGQRVRIVSYLGSPIARARITGREGVIVATSIMSGLWTGQVGYLINVGGSVGHIELPGLCLQLVVPAGSAPGSWDECPWKPPLNKDG